MKFSSFRIMLPVLAVATLLCQQQYSAEAFATTSQRTKSLGVTTAYSPRRPNASQLLASSNDNEHKLDPNSNPLLAASLALTIATTALQPISAANAYVPSDYASDTVQTVIGELKQAAGNEQATFKAYENIAGIITEGKGVGGMVNYSE